jgi:6-pyruvoyltetrahydropterin/6-carboxytetrahydropterin synthase
MSVAYLTRRVTFSAAHRYWREEWTDDRNREVFGPCANPHGHGHNYVLEATVEGPIDPETGFCVYLEFGAGGRVPTTENLVAWAWPRIVDGLPAGVRLHRLRLREDEALHVDYFGGGPGSAP